MPVLELSQAHKTYPGANPVHAVRGVSLRIDQGEYVAIEGPSGSGKSTLLNLLALLDSPTTGGYLIDGEDTSGLSETARARLRSEQFAFVFQSFHLLDSRTVIDNVELGLMYRGTTAEVRRRAAKSALAEVGLAAKAWYRADRLSGGERQRVAIARAIAAGAAILVADEPTGNLDSENSAIVVRTLARLQSRGITVIVVTHDDDVARTAPRRIHIRDGQVVADTRAAPSGPLVPPVAASQLDLRDAATEVIPAVPATLKASPSAPTTKLRASRLRLRDLIADAFAGAGAKPARTLSLVAAVAVGVGLAITTIGMSQTSQAQVSDAFDATLNRQVTMQLADLTARGQQTVHSPATMTRISGLAGVQDAAVVTSSGSVSAQRSPAADPVSAGLYGATAELPDSGEIGIAWSTDARPSGADTLVEPDTVLVGSKLADQLELGPLDAAPVIWVNNQPHVVAGIIQSSPRMIDILEGVIFNDDEAAAIAAPTYATAFLHTQAGAAQQVARQGPDAWDPWEADKITVSAPPDPMSLRNQVEGSLNSTLIVLTGVALLAAIIGLANSMVMSVLQRAGELGLRRAIGARRIHICSLITGESILVGAAGGILGLIIGFLALMAITMSRHWQPIFDVRLAPLALVGGILVGGISGLLAGIRSVRIEPIDALRA